MAQLAEASLKYKDEIIMSVLFPVTPGSTFCLLPFGFVVTVSIFKTIETILFLSVNQTICARSALGRLQLAPFQEVGF